MSKPNYSWRLRKKIALIKYKGGKCNRCGYDDLTYPAVFHFHHTDPSNKVFNICNFIMHSLESLKEELDKTELVCANCHAKIHGEKSVESVKRLIINEGDWSIREKTKIGKEQKLLNCYLCKQDFHAKWGHQKYCSTECAHRSSRKVERPHKQSLKRLMENYSWCALGRMFNVSDNAVRKWAKQYGLIE